MKPNLQWAGLEAQSPEHGCIHNSVHFCALITLKSVSEKPRQSPSIFLRILYVFMKMILYSSKSFWAWTNLYLFIVILCTICI